MNLEQLEAMKAKLDELRKLLKKDIAGTGMIQENLDHLAYAIDVEWRREVILAYDMGKLVKKP